MKFRKTAPEPEFVTVSQRTGSIVVRVVQLCLICGVVVGCILFLTKFSVVLRAHNGSCRVVNPLSGSKCDECLFEVDVGAGGQYRTASIGVSSSFDSSGEIRPSLDAFRCCPRTQKKLSCCQFGPSRNGYFCDSEWPDCKPDPESWPCYYSLQEDSNGMTTVPYDIHEGSTFTLFIPLVVSCALFIIGGTMIMCFIRFFGDQRAHQLSTNNDIMENHIAAKHEPTDANFRLLELRNTISRGRSTKSFVNFDDIDPPSRSTRSTLNSGGDSTDDSLTSTRLTVKSIASPKSRSSKFTSRSPKSHSRR